MIVALLTLIIGVAVGWYAERVLLYLKDIRSRLRESKEYKESGVVRPGVTPVKSSTAQPMDMSSTTGGVRRRTADEYMLANIKEREQRVKGL